jgi:4-azaleucine resistance transporter AzlC
MRGIFLVCASVSIMGISYGLAAHTAGIPLWANLLLAVFVLAGSSEFLFVAAVGAGVPPILAALTSALVNTRCFVFGFSVASFLKQGRSLWLAGHLINDEAVALALVEGKREGKRLLYWVTGVGILISWPIGAAIGAMLGGVIPDPAALGVDAVLPAVLIAIAYPAMKDRWTAGVVMAGAVLAVAATPVVPVGVGPVVALAALPLVLLRKRVLP